MVIKSKFGKDLLVWYSSLNFNDGSNKVTKTDFIWYNSPLKITDRVFYIKCISENGIKKIEDLIDDNNRFLTYQMFLDKCNVNINAITYYGIILRILFVTQIFIGSSTLNVSIYSEKRRGIYFSPQKL